MRVEDLPSNGRRVFLYPLALKDAALAMRKFGGDGTVYIYVVRDEGGKPRLNGIPSMPVALEKITRKPV